MTQPNEGRPVRLVFQPFREDGSARSYDEDRRKELEAAAETRHLSQEETMELNRLVESSGVGYMVEGPEFDKLGVTDAHVFKDNFFLLMEETEASYEAGYWFEAISLRLLALDLMLRIFIVHKTDRPITPHSTEDKMSFGTLIKKAKKAGLSKDLADALWAFNKGETTACTTS